jgi:hypothetical protein
MIMDVKDLLATINTIDLKVEGTSLKVSGWLVLIDENLFLLEQDIKEDYKNSMRLKISNDDIIYAIRQTILPLGGGESFVFHKAEITGLLYSGVPPEILVQELHIQERGQNHMLPVDITPEAIDAGRKRYETAFNFDFFKEMGD